MQVILYFLGLLVVFILQTQALHAHGITTAILSVTEVSPSKFVLNWEKTGGLNSESDIYSRYKPKFPESCVLKSNQLTCDSQGLFGTVGFDGLSAENNTAVMSLKWRDQSSLFLTFTQKQSEITLGGGGQSWWNSAKNFTILGMEHILLGWDHLLFVLALLWLTPKISALLRTITAFTVAHSITLTISTFNIVHLPSRPVEALIALSIALVCVESLRKHRHAQEGISGKNPWLVAFFFGLLHGFGFAGALSDIAIPNADIPFALFSFNVGVEMGQLAFIGIVFPVSKWLKTVSSEKVFTFRPLLPYCAGSLAMYWFWERLL